MRIKGIGKKAVAILIVSLLYTMGISNVPNNASAAPYQPLGSTSAYSLISAGVLSLGATTNYSGDIPIKGACTSITCNETMVASFSTAHLTLIPISDTATVAVQAVTSARTLLIGLTKTNSIDATTAIVELSPGVYETTSDAALGVTTSFTLNGGGDYDSVFVFRTTAAINFTASIEILFTNGAQPSNIYWVAGTAITTGASSKIPGNLIAVSAITTGASSIVRGSVLGLGAVTLGASSSIVHNAAIPQPLPGAALGAPIFLEATADNAQVALTWSAPSSNGGSAIASYTVSSSPVVTPPAGCTITPNLFCTFTGLTNGIEYTFSVIATNATVSGPASATTTATPKTTPTAPTGFSATTLSTRVALTWAAPTSNGGSVITDYRVEFSTDGSTFTIYSDGTSTTTSTTVTGLVNATAYTFRVSAVNAVGAGTASTLIATPAPTVEEIEAARVAAENARLAAATAEAARLAEISRAAAVAAENARVAAATAEAARVAELARAAVIEAARLALIEAERARLAEIARLVEIERIANCKSTISNLQYSGAAPGSSVGQLSWTTTGNGVFQYFGDTFLYPAFMQYGVYTADWNGYVINLIPGVRYQVSVNYLSDCGQISGVSMSIMNEKEVALTVPTPTATPTPFPTPAPSLIIQIPIPVVTKRPAPIELVQPVKTGAPAPLVTVEAIVFKTVTIKAINQSTVHVILHNLIPGQKVTITLRTVNP